MGSGVSLYGKNMEVVPMTKHGWPFWTPRTTLFNPAPGTKTFSPGLTFCTARNQHGPSVKVVSTKFFWFLFLAKIRLTSMYYTRELFVVQIIDFSLI